MLLTAIFEKWTEVKVTEAAQRLGISRMSASRCFDEMEYLNIPVLGMKGKSRGIIVLEERKSFWNQIEGLLRNPVIRRFVLKEDVGCKNNTGITTLREYSLLSDNL